MDTNARHQCFIYSGAPSQQLPVIGETLKAKLEAGSRCLYLNSPPMVCGLRSYLASRGVDVMRETERGALLISSDQGHLVDSIFEIDPMIDLLRSAVLQSLADGFVGLWASGDMTWEFGNEVNLIKLLEYECRLEQLFHECPGLSGICQYDMNTLPSYTIQQALYAHPVVYFNETLTRVNPHYIPPKILGEGAPLPYRPELQRMLEGLGLPSYPASAA